MNPFELAVGLALFVWMALGVWFLVVLIYLLLKRPVKSQRQVFLICSAALVLVPGLVSDSSWRRLVLHTCGPGRWGIAFISASARAGDIDSVEFLLSRGYKLDFESGLFWDSPLTAAIHGNQTKMVRYLISKGVEVNAPAAELTGTPLMEAAEEGNLEIAKILVQAGADICAKNQTRETAIDIARSKGSREVLAYLQEKQTCH